MTYNGLESCILNNHAYETESPTSRGDGCVSDSLDEDASSCSSSNNATGSYSSHWTMMKRDEQGLDEWEVAESAKQFYCKEKPIQSLQFSDVEAMKERFAKLLLGEDVTGGHKGLPTALALSNAITNLAGTLSVHFLTRLDVMYFSQYIAIQGLLLHTCSLAPIINYREYFLSMRVSM